jgi:hypothetical protein
MMKRLFIQSCVALLCASCVVSAQDSRASRRAKYNFNSGWKLFVGDPAGAERPDLDDSAWKDVTLPHARNEDDAFRKDIKDLSTGVAWYRKRFKLPPGSDGRNGNTPRSLGYVTFTFPPVTGSSLKVELTGGASDRDAFGNIVEIPGTPDPQSAAGKGGAKNTLGIVEPEIYEPVAVVGNR